MEHLIENEYIKVYKSFKENDLEKQINNLEELSIYIEDEILKGKIKKYIEVSNLLPKDSSMLNYKNIENPELIAESLKSKREIQKYIEEIIKNKKPYWQVIAEQNGWIPPKLIKRS